MGPGGGGEPAAAEAALEHPVGSERLVWDEFPHAIEYAVYAYLQLGDDKAALAQVRRLQTTERMEPTFKTAFHLASTQARYALERHDWAAAAALRPREPVSLDWDKFAWAEAVTWFAKGLGASHLGKVDAAREAVGRLGELKTAMDHAGEPAFVAQIRDPAARRERVDEPGGRRSRTRRSRCFGGRRSWRRRRRSRR